MSARKDKSAGRARSGQSIGMEYTEKPPPMFARVSQGLIGGMAVQNQLPLLARYAKGRANLWHGTNLESAQGILGSPQGIDPSFAGIGKSRSIGDQLYNAYDESMGRKPHISGKAARINRYGMAESLIRTMESEGIAVTNAQKTDFTKQFNSLMDSGMRSGEAAQAVFDKVTGELVRENKLTPKQLSALQAKMGPDLVRHGQRVFFGTHPADVTNWGSAKGELELVGKDLLGGKNTGKPLDTLRQTARPLAEGLTGGAPSLVEDQLHRMNYKPTSLLRMTREQALAHLEQLKAGGGKYTVNFGAHVPTGKMQYLTDFPGVRWLMGLNPGLRTGLRRYLPQGGEAARDISFPHAVPSSNIHTMDILDDLGKITRIGITDFQKAKASPILSRLKGMAVPAALTGLGAYNVYRAFKPRKRMVPKRPEEIEKASGVVAKEGLQALKYVLPIGAVSTGIGIGSGAIMNKLIPEKDGSGAKHQAAEFGKAQARRTGSSILNVLGHAGVGAGTAVLLGKYGKSPTLRALGTKGNALLGAGLGYAASMLPGAMAAAGMEQGKHPEADTFLSLAPQKVQDYVRSNPWVSGAMYGGLGTATPAVGALMLRKYYPSLFARSVEAGKRAFGRLSNASGF